MKLTFTTTEMTEGTAKRRMGDKRYAEITAEMATTKAFNVTPQRIPAGVCSGVLIQSIEREASGTATITLLAVCLPVFEVYTARGELNALIVDAVPQMTIEYAHEGGVGTRNTTATLRGPGSDPLLVEKAEVAFGRLVNSQKSDPLVREMIALVGRMLKRA